MDNASTHISASPNTHEKPILTREEAASYAGGVSYITIDRWRKHGSDGRPPLPYLKLGKVILIDRDTLHQWLTSVSTVAARGKGRPRKHPLRR